MNKSSFALDNGLYNATKWVALILLPALGALYFGLGQIWDFPEIEKVIGSITVLDTFLGLLLRQSTKNYRSMYSSGERTTMRGDLVITTSPEGGAEGMRFEVDQEFIPDEGEIAGFRVKREELPKG